MEIERYGIRENDGYIDFDIIIKFKKAISISSEFKILRGQFDVDKNCLKNSATCSSIWIVGTIKLLDEIKAMGYRPLDIFQLLNRLFEGKVHLSLLLETPSPDLELVGVEEV